MLYMRALPRWWTSLHTDRHKVVIHTTSFAQVPYGGSIVVPGNAYFQASSGFDFGPPVAGATIICGYSDGRPDTKSHYGRQRRIRVHLFTGRLYGSRSHNACGRP